MDIAQALAAAAALVKAGDAEAAEIQLRELVRLYPEDERPLLRLGWLLHERGRKDEADGYFAAVLAKDFALTDAKAHGSAFDQHCHAIFRSGVNATTLARVRALCEADIGRYGLRSWTALFLGALAHCGGREADAFEHFRACIRLGDSLLGNTHGSLTYRDDDFVAGLDCYEMGRSRLLCPLDTQHLRHHRIDSDAVAYVLSCDGYYFSVFGAAMLTSFSRFSEGAICHVHVINPTDESRQVAETALREFPALRVNITESAVAFDAGVTKLNRKAFFTCGRFLILPELLRHYRLPALVSEFDGELIHAPAFFANALHRADIGLSLYDSMNFLPWNTVWAGTVFVNSTALGVRFAGLVAKYCAKFLDMGDHAGNFWHVDQNALYCVYRYLSRTQPELVMHDVKKSLPSLMRHHGGIY